MSRLSTQEKALKWIQNRIAEISGLVEAISTSKNRNLSSELAALQTARVAIQRYTPSQAIEPGKTHKVRSCPRCGHYLADGTFYCGYCGQHIKYTREDMSGRGIIEELTTVTIATKKNDAGKPVIEIFFENGSSLTVGMDLLLAAAFPGDKEITQEVIVRYPDYH